MRYPVGRALQATGLAVVGVGLAVGLLRDDLRTEERMLFVGVILFFAGWLLVRPFRVS